MAADGRRAEPEALRIHAGGGTGRSRADVLAEGAFGVEVGRGAVDRTAANIMSVSSSMGRPTRRATL